jgi:gliding motility-associated-like protein
MKTIKALGLFIFALTLSAVVRAQGSNTCAGAAANPIALPFFANNQSLCGDANDYSGVNACAVPNSGNYYGGQDWIYSFTPSQNGYINIALSDIVANGQAYPTISLLSACPGTAGACLGFVQCNAWQGGGNLVEYVQAGQTYYVLVDMYTWSNYFANCCQFDLSIQLNAITVQPACSNINFNNGNLNSWYGTTGLSLTGVTNALTPNYSSTGYGLVNSRQTIMTGGNDPCAGFPRVDPQGGSFSVRLGNNNVNSQAEQLLQTFMVSESNNSFTYRYAVVFEDPGHASHEQPFFRALLRDQNGNIIPCSDFVVSAAADLPGFFNSTTCTGVVYKPWSTVNVDLTNYIGQQVTVEFTTGDCSQGAHYGYAYIDANCAPSLLSALSDTICVGQSTVLTAPAGYESYTWLPGNQTTTTIAVSPATSTTYQLNLTAFNGCVSQFQIPVTVAPYPVASFTSNAPACDEPVQLQNTSSVSSGTISSVSWLMPGATPSTSSQSSPSISYPGTGPATFPVTLSVSNTAGCTSTITQNVSLPACALSAQITGATLCEGSCFTIIPVISSGTAPFTYVWSNGSTNPTLTVCPSASQIITLTVTDAAGNSDTDTAMLAISAPPQFNGTLNMPACNGGSNGSISVNPTGNAPYAIAWSTGSALNTLSNLSAGTYAINATDALGCPFDTAFQLIEPTPITAAFTSLQSTCGQANGQIQVTNVSGGTIPYAYRLNGGPTQASPVFSNVAAGNHTITITDANGCSINLAVAVGVVNAPSAMTLQISNTTCGAANGFIHLTQITGGSAPYSVQFGSLTQSFNGTALVFSQLIAGAYNLVVTDANGCQLDSTAVLSNAGGPGALAAALTPATCNQNNGALNITGVNGGTAPYTFSFNGGAFSASQSWSNLTPATYTISVLDANSCSFDTSLAIQAIPSIQSSASVLSNVRCFGGNDGAAQLIISQGTAPFDIQWSNGSTNTTVQNLSAGAYTVSLTDANGCTANHTITIEEPAAISAEISVQPALCGNANGSIEVQDVTGGTPSYTYAINSGVWQNNASFYGLNTGTYAVQVRDNNGCLLDLSATLDAIAYPSGIEAALQDASCGLENGSLTLSFVDGGIAPFSVSFDGQAPLVYAGSGNIAFNGLAQGNHTISVTDANGCMIDSLLPLAMIAGPQSISVTAVPETCGAENASLVVNNVNGGTPLYLYSFNNSPFSSTSSWSNLSAGTYTLLVRDQNNCELDTFVQINGLTMLETEAVVQRNVSCYGGNNGMAFISVSEGTAPFTFTWSNGIQSSVANNLQSGVYAVTITDGNGCINEQQVSITQPDSLAFGTVLNLPICEQNNGSIEAVNATGGTGSLQYALNNGAFGANSLFQNLAAGVYTVRLRDSLNCQTSAQVTLVMPSYPTLAVLSGTDATCGLANGSIFVESIDGGIAPFEYALNQGTFSAINSVPFTLPNLNGGSYALTVRDANGCLINVSQNLNQHPGPSAMVLETTSAICGIGNGSASIVSVSGGTAPYQYSFDNSSFSAVNQFDLLSPDIYPVAVRDANGCMVDSFLTIIAEENVAANAFIVQPISCFNGHDGALQANPISGAAPFQITWNNGTQSNIIDSLSAGTYSVQVSDANGCIVNQTISLNQPPQVNIVVNGPAEVCEGSPVTLVAQVSGGSGHLSLSWPQFSHTEEELNITPTASDSYLARVDDENGCWAIDSHFVMLRLLPQGTITPDIAEGCAPVCIDFTVTQTAGSPIQQYSWSFNNQSGYADPNQKFCFYHAGQPEIEVVLTDVYGCSNRISGNGSVTIHPQPVADFSRTPNQADIANPVYQFFNESTDATSFVWNFGDGTYALTENPSHQYADTGSYMVCLRVTSGFGCVDSVCKSIDVNPFPTIYAPNVFTPDSDGTNDRFKVVCTYATKFRLEIYDRWGELIHVSTDPDEGWDGTYKGNGVQQDVYVWKAYVTNSMYFSKELIGRVTVLE